jgi:hypothetical protein
MPDAPDDSLIRSWIGVRCPSNWGELQRAEFELTRLGATALEQDTYRQGVVRFWDEPADIVLGGPLGPMRLWALNVRLQHHLVRVGGISEAMSLPLPDCVHETEAQAFRRLLNSRWAQHCAQRDRQRNPPADQGVREDFWAFHGSVEEPTDWRARGEEAGRQALLNAVSERWTQPQGEPALESLAQQQTTGLSQQQLDALPILEWLISLDDRDRRTGRTLAIAVATVRMAAANPGRSYRFWDHSGYRRQNEAVGDTIRSLLEADSRLSPHARIHENSLKLNLERPLRNWFPRWHHSASPTITPFRAPLPGVSEDPSAIDLILEDDDD